MNKKYTLDQITAGQYVFLERPEEVRQLVIPINEVSQDLSEGVIVEIRKNDSGYEIKALKEETKITREKVNDLLEKLKNKKN